MALVRTIKSARARDEEPLTYRRAFGVLSRAIFGPEEERRLIQVINSGASADEAARAIGWWNPVDPQGAWLGFYERLIRAYAGTISEVGQKELDKIPAARGLRFEVQKASRKPIMIGSGRFQAGDLAVPPNPHSMRWIETQAGELIKMISNEQLGIVRGILHAGYARSTRPETMAEEIKQVVGLTAKQTDAVQRRWVQVFNETGSADEAHKAAARYRDQQLTYRANNIARTENREAVEQGRLDAWRVARDEGAIDASTKRGWTSLASSFRLCKACAELDGEEAGLDEPFYSSVLGRSVMKPPLHPKCRCSVVLNFY